MSRAPRSARSTTTTRWLALALLVGWLLWQDANSIERGNRLYRRGDLSGAARVYAARATATTSRPAASYNLGTALLRSESDGAEEPLRRASASDVRDVAQKGAYNLGYYLLTAAAVEPAPESAAVLLEEAVAQNRVALRLDPSDGNARWNLVVSQLLLDSVGRELAPFRGALPESSPGGLRSGREADDPGNDAENPEATDGAEEDREGSRSNNNISESRASGSSPSSTEAPSDLVGRTTGSAGPGTELGSQVSSRFGSREALAGEDPGAVAARDALAMINDVVDEAETLIRGILWAYRPDVAWWNGEPFPGGDW